MKTRQQKSKEQYNYYDFAPEHNEQMNVEGFRNLLLIMFAIIMITVSILIIRYCHDKLFTEPARVDQVDTDNLITVIHPVYCVPIHEYQA